MTITELYDLAKSGDKPAEDELFRHLLVSFRMIVQHQVWSRSDGEEVVQEALMVIADKYAEIDIKSSFAGWCHGVLNNKILDYVKLKQLRREKADDFLRQQPATNANPPDPVLRDRIKKCFTKICGSHPQHARILNLKTQGFTTDEICQRLKMTRNNCYVTLSRARRMLEACLFHKEEDS